MRTRLSVTGLALMVGIGSAFAADLPVKAPAVAPLPVPAYNWSGWYVGVHAGYGWGDTSIGLSSSDPGLFGPAISQGAIPRSLSTDADGFLGGIQAGFNLQNGPIVYGVEADIAFGRLDGSSTITTNQVALFWPILTTTHDQRLDWLATFRGRIGLLATPRLLTYVTAGLAVGGVEASTNVVIPAGGCAANSLCGFGAISETSVGWTGGGGLEYAFADRWSLKVEYLYFDLGTSSYTVFATSPVFVGNPNWLASAKFSGHIVRAGLNWRF